MDSWVLESGMQFKESGQRSGIQHLKSRIRDCLGFHYLGRGVGTLLYTRIDKMTMRNVKFLVLGNDRMACPWLSLYDSTNTSPSDSSDILKEPTSQTLYSNSLCHWQRFLRPFYCWIDLPSTCLFGKCWNGHKLRDIGLIDWFSNRAGTSVDDGGRKSNNWLDRWQSDTLSTGSRV